MLAVESQFAPKAYPLLLSQKKGYHCPQTCHGHIGSNPVFTALDSRKGVHAARLISLIKVLDDLYILFSRISEVGSL